MFVCEVFDPFGSGECWAGHASPDLDADLYYFRGDGALVKVDEGTCMSDVDGKCGAAGRTETLNFRPTAQTALGVGTYEIQVHGSDPAIAATVTILDQVFVCDLEIGGDCWVGHMSPDLDAELRYVRADGARVTVDEGTCMADAESRLKQTLRLDPPLPVQHSQLLAYCQQLAATLGARRDQRCAEEEARPRGDLRTG